MKIPYKKFSLSSLRVDNFWYLWWYVFAPWKFFLILDESFYTVNTQNLQESKRIHKGQKTETKGFLLKLARKLFGKFSYTVTMYSFYLLESCLSELYSVGGRACLDRRMMDPDARYWYCRTNTNDWDYACRPGSSCGYSDGYNFSW